MTHTVCNEHMSIPSCTVAIAKPLSPALFSFASSGRNTSVKLSYPHPNGNNKQHFSSLSPHILWYLFPHLWKHWHLTKLGIFSFSQGTLRLCNQYAIAYHHWGTPEAFPVDPSVPKTAQTAREECLFVVLRLWRGWDLDDFQTRNGRQRARNSNDPPGLIDLELLMSAEGLFCPSHILL